MRAGTRPASRAGPALGSRKRESVLAAWLAGTARLVPDIEVDLGPAAVGDAEVETARCWAVADWMVRSHAPLWLAAGGQTDTAAYLRALDPVTGPGQLSKAAPALESALMVGNDAVVRVWGDVLDRAGVGEAKWYDDPRRDECWQAITRASNRRSTSMAARTVEAAEAAIGARPPGTVPTAWRLAGAVVTEMIDLLAWTAIAGLTRRASWSWTTAPTVAATQAATAVDRALAPTTHASRASARQLSGQLTMLYVGSPGCSTTSPTLPELPTGPCWGPTPERSEQ